MAFGSMLGGGKKQKDSNGEKMSSGGVSWRGFFCDGWYGEKIKSTMLTSLSLPTPQRCGNYMLLTFFI